MDEITRESNINVVEIDASTKTAVIFPIASQKSAAITRAPAAARKNKKRITETDKKGGKK
ncbi:hypothetical protein [Methanolapillus africanus]|uniref:hypothetical protein n=1 Tax=Methanolapillus africanus TaxID=3028297 RepID=UPI0030B8C64D